MILIDFEFLSKSFALVWHLLAQKVIVYVHFVTLAEACRLLQMSEAANTAKTPEKDRKRGYETPIKPTKMSRRPRVSLEEEFNKGDLHSEAVVIDSPENPHETSKAGMNTSHFGVLQPSLSPISLASTISIHESPMPKSLRSYQNSLEEDKQDLKQGDSQEFEFESPFESPFASPKASSIVEQPNRLENCWTRLVELNAENHASSSAISLSQEGATQSLARAPPVAAWDVFDEFLDQERRSNLLDHRDPVESSVVRSGYTGAWHGSPLQGHATNRGSNRMKCSPEAS